MEGGRIEKGGVSSWANRALFLPPTRVRCLVVLPPFGNICTADVFLIGWIPDCILVELRIITWLKNISYSSFLEYSVQLSGAITNENVSIWECGFAIGSQFSHRSEFLSFAYLNCSFGLVVENMVLYLLFSHHGDICLPCNFWNVVRIWCEG